MQNHLVIEILMKEEREYFSRFGVILNFIDIWHVHLVKGNHEAHVLAENELPPLPILPLFLDLDGPNHGLL